MKLDALNNLTQPKTFQAANTDSSCFQTTVNSTAYGLQSTFIRTTHSFSGIQIKYSAQSFKFYRFKRKLLHKRASCNVLYFPAREDVANFDPAVNSAQWELQARVVMAHEVAHMWLGNLATPVSSLKFGIRDV